jgi:pimeloyl-ACP methyl ester carboxylesterase
MRARTNIPVIKADYRIGLENITGAVLVPCRRNGARRMIVFVHGVPETAAIWKKLAGMIGQASIALSLPGFGCPRPEGFGATKEDYVDWLVGELQTIEEPIDLVGHDWGAGLTYRVATVYGERIRSWAIDIANVVHPDYVWHDIARVWQTPGEGEAFFERATSVPPQERAPRYEDLGVPPDGALEIASGVDATMGTCILDLYRSAMPNIYYDWGPLVPTRAPGLVLHPVADPFGNEPLAAEVANSLGAQFERIDGVAHFWPYQAPEKVAPVLKSFWSRLD